VAATVGVGGDAAGGDAQPPAASRMPNRIRAAFATLMTG
jgi:hypothetical protein